MGEEEYNVRQHSLDIEEADLRRRLQQLEEIVQKAPGSHSPGDPRPSTIEAEREIQDIVLRLADIDRERQQLSLAATSRR